MELVLPDLRAGYRVLLEQVWTSGRPVQVRRLPTRELTGITLRFPNPAAPMLPLGTGRGVSIQFAAVEALDVIAGTCHPSLLDRAGPGWRNVLIDPADAAIRYAAYGPRLAPQLDEVIARLRSTSRSALATIWHPRDLDWYADVPCTVALQLLLRDDRLELHVFMRSQDAWLGSAYDHFVFSQLQWTIANLLGVRPGVYVHHVGSLHIYDRDGDEVERVIKSDAPLGNVTLPSGLRPTRGQLMPWRPQMHALDLLEDRASPVVQANNPWYAGRLRPLHEDTSDV